MDIYAFVPVRLDSKRFPRKPLCNIFNKPLLHHLYNSIKETNIFNNNIFLISSDKEIEDYCLNNNIPFILTEGNFKCGTDRIAWVANKLNLKDNDLIFNIQGDIPFVNKESIINLIELFSYNNIYWGTLFTDLNKDDINNTNIVKLYLDNNRKIIYFKRLFDEINLKLYHHIGIYVFYNYFLQIFSNLKQSNNEKLYSLEQLRGVDNNYNIYGVYTSAKYYSIDSPEDLENYLNYMEDSKCQILTP